MRIRPSLSISGTRPGLLDHTQCERVLRHPASTLSFAAFDPRTASAHKGGQLRNSSLNEELYRAKRVVIESTPTGDSFWRFVPKARMEDGVADEGPWPRLIQICGQLVNCSQDQWDVYKLDPEYECYVKAPPGLTTVTRVVSKPPCPEPEPTPSKKRRMPTPWEKAMPQPSTRNKFQHPSHGQYTDESEQSSSSEEEEVEDIIIDDHLRPRSKSAELMEWRRKHREEINKNRMLRREKITRAEMKYAETRNNNVTSDASMLDLSQGYGPSTPTARSVPPESPGKRKGNPDLLYNPLREDNGTDDKVNKRSRRTASPSSVRRDIAEKRKERERKKKEKRDSKLEQRRQEKLNKFMEEVLADVPEDETTPIGPNVSHEGELDEEAARKAAIEESRRKLAELEADRPLWEEQAKRREMLERREEEARRAKREQQRREEAETAKAEKRVQEKEEREAREREDRKREEMARREWERRQRQQRWSTGPWTTQRALERYKNLCEYFDTTKFSLDEPLAFDVVPWPILQSPMSFTVEDVDWGAVERFFEAMKPHMRAQDYNTFVEKSQRRFHPDRWRSRGLLKSVEDDVERGCLEVAANTVAQALTPLWRELTGRC